MRYIRLLPIGSVVLGNFPVTMTSFKKFCFEVYSRAADEIKNVKDVEEYSSILALIFCRPLLAIYCT